MTRPVHALRRPQRLHPARAAADRRGAAGGARVRRPTATTTAAAAALRPRVRLRLDGWLGWTAAAGGGAAQIGAVILERPLLLVGELVGLVEGGWWRRGASGVVLEVVWCWKCGDGSVLVKQLASHVPARPNRATARR